MAIIGTGAITLDQVRTALGLGATASLQDCFNAANYWCFAPLYGGDDYEGAGTGYDRLSNFRGYNTALLISFYRGTSGSSSSAICLNGATVQVWHSGVNLLPEVDDVIYTNSGGTTEYVGGFNHWIPIAAISVGSTNQTALVNAVGVVLSRSSCAQP